MFIESRPRLTSFCGIINSTEITYENNETNNHVINITGIDFDRYNSINKKHLFLEVFGVFGAFAAKGIIPDADAVEIKGMNCESLLPLLSS
jgi:hypothetical protein